ncbi:hypothetical protein COCON_G00127900 [Conger conger]|uniref:3CxxC-type domain-containing protein n=1 Tax=Conger conger TaxID=82655 RepID=A0A9Q1DDD1_CONCO|nr:hypothetical protein COCON_G00127900 [Conger conger]
MNREWSDTFGKMLHYDDRWILQFSNSLQNDLSQEEKKEGWKIHKRSAYGNFRCGACSRGWPSAQVTVLFHYRLCTEMGQGTVIMQTFGQACRRCNKGFEQPAFSTEEVKKVLLKLTDKIKKNCYGEEGFDNACFSLKLPTKPHERSLCEACRKGICSLED